MSHFKLFTILFLMCLLGQGAAYSKPGKVKYSKYLVYEGEVEEGEPKMHGVLKCIDPVNKDIDMLTIEGDFSGSYISNATISSNGLHGFGFDGSLSYKINVEDKTNTILTLTLGSKKISKLTHDNINITSTMQPFIMIRNLNMTLSINKKDKVWNIGYGEDNTPTSQCVASIDQMEFPTCVEQFEYTKKNLKGIQCNVAICRDSIYSTDKACTFIFDDQSYFFDDKLTFGTGGSFIINGISWIGNHRFVDGTNATRVSDGNMFKIEYNNGDTYSGSVACPDLAKAFGRNATRKSFSYLNGVYKSGLQKEEWIDGESFSQRHERWMKKYDADLVDSLENKILTTQQCDSAMTKRAKIEEEKKALEELAIINAATAAEHAKNTNYEQILSRHWKAKKSVFLEGTAKEWYLANVPEAKDFSSSLFTCYLTLTLQSNGTACLVVRVGPSKAAYKLGNEQTVKILSLCNQLSKQYTGIWTTSDMKIYIDTKDIGLTFSSDGKSVKYKDSVLSGVMKYSAK